MKNRIYLYITSILLALPACSDSFLDLSPDSSLTEKNFYVTESHFEQAVNGIYEGLRPLVERNGLLMAEMRSDNAHYMRNLSDRGKRQAEEIADFTNDAINDFTGAIYQDCYTGIARANSVIDRMEGKDFSESFTNSIIGQAKTLRAYFYFELVRYFGPVSLHLNEVLNPDNAFFPRSSVDDVYAAIIDDLKDAINRLDNPVAASQSGRVTKGTAKMIYAQVLMTKPTRDYAEAEKQLRDIMNMGYGLIDYADLFDAKHKNSIESVFEVQYKQGDTGQQSKFIYWMMPLTSSGDVLTGVAGSGNTTDGGFVIPTQEIVDMFEPGDKRRDVSIKVAAGSIDETTGIMNIQAVYSLDDPEISNYSYYSYFVDKYRNLHEKINNTDDNFYIYRYADVLLSLSECLVNQNRAAEATEYVNLVRERAGVATYASVDAQTLADERRRELAFENKRWHDLVRTGQAITVMNAYGVRMKQIHKYLEDRSYQVNENKLIHPIPYRELQINDLLKQNDGY